jgi:hypothetical protein
MRQSIYAHKPCVLLILAHFALAAFFAMSCRCFLVSFLAPAKQPFIPPVRPISDKYSDTSERCRAGSGCSLSWDLSPRLIHISGEFSDSLHGPILRQWCDAVEDCPNQNESLPGVRSKCEFARH